MSTGNADEVARPELVFGIVGPIGVDLDGVIDSLSASLASVGYRTKLIHLTELMKDDRIDHSIDAHSYYARYASLIEYANKFREYANHNGAMAGLAINEIREIRKNITESYDKPAFGIAYIIRQFKRPEEIDVMRQTYGRKFVLLSVYSSPSARRKLLVDKIKRFNNSPKLESDCEKEAIQLIADDYNQKSIAAGQRISDVFHLGDVFVDG